jgi:hypothetical protein
MDPVRTGWGSVAILVYNVGNLRTTVAPVRDLFESEVLDGDLQGEQAVLPSSDPNQLIQLPLVKHQEVKRRAETKRCHQMVPGEIIHRTLIVHFEVVRLLVEPHGLTSLGTVVPVLYQRAIPPSVQLLL